MCVPYFFFFYVLWPWDELAILKLCFVNSESSIYPWNSCGSSWSPEQQIKFNSLLEFSLGFLDHSSEARDWRLFLLCSEVISPFWQCLSISQLQCLFTLLPALLGGHFENNIWLPFHCVKPVFNLAGRANCTWHQFYLFLFLEEWLWKVIFQ